MTSVVRPWADPLAKIQFLPSPLLTLLNRAAEATYDAVSKLDGQLHESVQLGQGTGAAVAGGGKHEAHISV